MKTLSAKELFELAKKDVQTMPRVKLEMAAGTLMVLIAQLGVALRHPENKGPSSERTRDWMRFVAEKVPPNFATWIREANL